MELIILFCWSHHSLPINYFLLGCPTQHTESFKLFHREF